MAGLQAAVDGSAPWTTEGPRCFDVFAAACEAGTADACSWAALTAFERIGGASLDVARVHALLGKGCELGSADGCRNVGALHLRGELGDEGPAAQAAARPWFDKACALGHAQACEEAEALAPKLVQVQGANLKAGSMTVDGFEVRELACALEGPGALFGTMAIAASLAERKKAVDACAPAGQAFVVHWRFAGSKTTEIDVRGGTKSQQTCVARAIGKAKAVMPARCGAIVFAGDAKTAEATIATLGS